MIATRAAHILLLVLPALFARGQDNTFFRKYNLSGMQGGLQLEETDDGGFVATGQHEGNGSLGSCDIYIYRVDACGNTIWFKLFGTGSSDGGKSIRQTSDGGFIVSGHYAGAYGFNLKLDADGNVQWARTYNALTWLFYSEETANGDYICLGQNSSGLHLFRTNSTGDVIWSRFMSGLGTMGFYVEELSNGDFVFTSSYISGRDVAAGRVSANGTMIWSFGYGSGWSEQDHTSWSCKGLLDEPDNSLVITSPTAMGMGTEDILVMKVNLDSGSVIWANAYGGPGSDQSREICKHHDGYSVVGNTNSYPVSAGSLPGITENMLERDILLLNLDGNGEIVWSRTYGGDNRDRGIGVKFNEGDESFTMSAFSNSTYFGNGGSMDPVFIKTDSLGFVSCQTASPTLTRTALNPAASPLGSLSASSIAASSVQMAQSTFSINDVYVCQNCLTEPLFEPSDTIVCINEPVYFYNTTQVGLTCFQEWQINGQAFNGGLDTLEYVFPVAGEYPVVLTSSCGGLSSTYQTTIRVFDVAVTQQALSNYNGFSVSCHGDNDGWIQAAAGGGYLGNGGAYQWQWEPPLAPGPLAQSLHAGTYEVKATDLAGCADSLVIVLSEPPPLSVTATATSSYSGFGVSCFGASDGALSAQAAGGTGVYQYAWNTNPVSAAQHLAQQPAGNYLVQVTDSNGCTATDPEPLTAPPPLDIVAVPLTNYNGYDVSCYQASDAQVQVTPQGGVGGYAMVWNGQPVQPGGLVGPTGAQDFVVSVSDANGCAAQVQGILNEPPQLTMNAQVTSNYNGVQISCPGAADGQASAQPSGGVQPYAYQWSDGSSAEDSFADLGVGYSHVAVTDANGCSVQDSVWLDEPLPISLQAWVTTDYNGFGVSCFGSSDGGAEALASGGVSPLVLSWSNGAAGEVLTDVPAGSYTVQATDANTCSLPSATVVITTPTPLAVDGFVLSDYDGYSVTCPDASDGEAEVSVSGGVEPYAIAWPNGNSGPLATGLPAGEVEVQVQDANGCLLSGVTELTEPPALQAEALVTSDYNGFAISCHGASDGSAAAQAAGAVEPYVYWWSEGTAGPTLQDVSVGTYTVYVTDAHQCDTLEVPVTLNQPTPLVIGGFTLSDYNGYEISCPGSADGEAEALVSGSVPPYTAAWSNGDSGLESNGWPAGQALITVTDLNGCMASDSVWLDEPEPMALNAEVTSDYSGYGVSCHGSADGSAEAAGSGGVSPLNYWWSGGSSGASLDNASAGDWTIWLTDANHCDTLDVTVELTQPDPFTVPVWTLSDYNGFAISCPGAADGSAAVDFSGSVPPYTVIWSDGANGLSTDNLPEGTVSFSATDQNGCTLEGEAVLEAPEPLELDWSAAPDTCDRSVGSIALDISGGVPAYVVAWGDGATGDFLCCLAAGEYGAQCTDLNGCQQSVQVTVGNLPDPVPLMDWCCEPLCAGESDARFVDLTDGSSIVAEWSFGDGDMASGEVAGHRFMEPGVYEVVLNVSDSRQCEAETSVRVEVHPPLSVFVPTAFTPDQDNLNEAFGPYGSGIRDYTLMVFNRWGDKVFESTPQLPRWNGSVQNENEFALPGVYTYRIVANGWCESKEVVGHVVLLR